MAKKKPQRPDIKQNTGKQPSATSSPASRRVSTGTAPKATAAKQASDSFWRNRELWMPILIVAIITFIVYLPSLSNTFVNWDDEDNLLKNPNLRNFDWGSIKGIFTSDVIGNYNPLPIFSFAVEKAIWGLNPKVFHFNNLLLHLICVFFSYRILLELGLSRMGAALGALLFGIHPMRVESVAWVTERKDVLYGAFYLPAFFLYLKMIKRPDGQQGRTYWTILILFTLSLFSKIQAVSLPLSMLVADYYLRRPINFGLIKEKLPHFFLSFMIGLLGIYVLAANKSLEDSTHYSIAERLLVGIYTYIVYLAKFVFPYRMSPLYPYPASLGVEFYTVPILILPLLFLMYLRYKKDDRVTLFAMGFFTVNIMFLLQILGAGQGFLADRFTYIAYLGLFFGIAWLYDYIVRHMPGFKGAMQGVMIVYLIMCAALSWTQIQIWENGGTLWTHVLKYYRDATTPWQNRGQYYRDNKEYQKALPDFNQAIALKPSATLFNSRGKLYFDSGNPDAAIKDYTSAIEMGDKEAKTIGEVHVNRGAALASKGLLEQAIQDFNKGLEIDPKQPNGYSNRSLYYYQTKQFEKAIADHDAYLKINPYNGDMYYERAICKAALNRHQDAIADFDRAISLIKEKPFFYIERGRSYMSIGNIPQAKMDVQRGKAMGGAVPPELMQLAQ